MFLDVMGEIPLPINHKKSQKEEGVLIHAVQVLVHHNNKNTTENKVYGAQHYTYTYKAHIMFRVLLRLGRCRGAITTKGAI